MKITEIDKNLSQHTHIDYDKIDFYNVTEKPFKLYGLKYNESDGFYRMPFDVLKENERLNVLKKHTSGGRVRFSTDSSIFAIRVEYDSLEPLPHMALNGSAGFMLCKNDNNDETLVSALWPTLDDKKGFTTQVTLEKELTNYTLYFPLYNNVKRISIGLEKGSIVKEGLEYRDIKPILYYGSSITQGACATRPDACYVARICKENNIDFINLGFSGNARAEVEMIEYLTTLDCSVMVFDYDWNAPSVEYLQETHYRMYEIYRNKKPKVPIILISRPDSLKPDAPARYKIIKDTFLKAKKSGDKNVYLVDGRNFFGKEYHNCMVDGIHPTDLGFYYMSKKIGKIINGIFVE